MKLVIEAKIKVILDSEDVVSLREIKENVKKYIANNKYIVSDVKARLADDNVINKGQEEKL